MILKKIKGLEEFPFRYLLATNISKCDSGWFTLLTSGIHEFEALALPPLFHHKSQQQDKSTDEEERHNIHSLEHQEHKDRSS